MEILHTKRWQPRTYFINNYNVLFLINLYSPSRSAQIVHKFLASFWYVCLLWLAISTRILCKECSQYYFPFNSGLSFQRLWGYHFHFVDSNRGSNNFCDFCPFLACVLILVSKTSATVMIGLLKDDLFQFSTSGNVYSELQASKTAFKHTHMFLSLIHIWRCRRRG